MIRGHWIRPVLALVLAAGAEFVSGEIYFRKGAPHVKLPNDALLSGMLEYSREGRPLSSFLGVPFGAKPERFEEAHLAPPWDGVLNATKHGQLCPQSFEMLGQTLVMGDEDCLYLNVHVPMNHTEKEGGYPVIVSVHGGAFSLGWGHMVGPRYFLEEDVILVTFNYRLGAFGFLSTGDSAIPGNYGMKDQVLALKWVQKNIKSFGGDPARVTIDGVSAGGASVHYLYLSPATEGLFQGAIAQSGSAFAAWAHNPHPKVNAAKLANYLNCPTDSADPSQISSLEISTCLKALTTEELNEVQLKFISRWPPKHSIPFDFVPVVEPKDALRPFLTESPWTSTSAKKDIPYMTGVTEDEGAGLYAGPIIHDEELLTELDTNWEDLILGTTLLDRYLGSPEEKKIVARKIRQFYFGDKAISKETRTNLTNMFSDALFLHAGRKAAIDAATNTKGNQIYLYQYAFLMGESSQQFGSQWDEVEANLVTHGADLFIMTPAEGIFPGTTDFIQPPAAEEFSKQFIKQLVHFAVHGKPDNSLRNLKEEWKPISRKELDDGNDKLRWFKLDSTSGYIGDGPFKERAQFWDKLYEEHIIPNLVQSP